MKHICVSQSDSEWYITINETYHKGCNKLAEDYAFDIGQSGGCGIECGALWDGECSIFDYFREDVHPKDKIEFEELYGEFNA
jgi:hypothetical protein